MKIIIVGTAYPYRGGIAHFNALLANYLSFKHNVEIINFKRQYPKFFFPGKSQEEKSNIANTNTKITQLIDSLNPFNWIRVAKIIKQKRPDLLIFKYWIPFFAPCFGTISKLVKKNSNTKILVICDNIFPHEKRIGDQALTKYFLNRADFFIVQSKSVEKDLLSILPKAKYTYAPHPVYEIFGERLDKLTARKHLNLNYEKIILFFGYIRKYKGLNILLEAISLIAKNQTAPHLLVVGEFYENESIYRKYVVENKLENQVTFVPDYVPNDKVHLYFSAADVVVLPYISATQSGIVQIAYNFNLPVIVTDVGGLSEVVIDNQTGYVIPPNDPKKLADAILKFYTEDKGPILIENIKQEKTKYSWEYFVSKIESIVSS